ncbi:MULTISPECIES: HTH domain-containing protein [unclassified Dysgonomonas]|jgi:DeoR/GlpR family transcriptional regulator of sugar metabolism|uniref:HTH domain-containing protein n=1 Tax=unclassified Dysgonomonas TaxID=2630389 RepID=UPI0025BE2A14|nr:MULTISPECIES: HTH domain-containing protein [unclassified Dysgonomonas]MDR2004020.1 helix-turn-helix domain-containing protein [Prevotella sp.]HMM02564.1 HTH domain-containing protein [Dysgonomonas sp.]
MKISEHIERLKLIQKLVQEEKTGSPDELANRLGISRGTLYSLIDELQSYNVSISYSRKKQSFIYNDDTALEIKYSIKLLNNDELTEISGGCSTFSLLYNFLYGKTISL